LRIEIIGTNFAVAEHTRQLIDEKCRDAFDRIAATIGDVRILIQQDDATEQGSRRCVLAIRFRRGAEIHAEATGNDLPGALDEALRRAERCAYRVVARGQDRGRHRVETLALRNG
jgi:ribosomal subunit interface protein